MVSNVNGINNYPAATAAKILPPKEDKLYRHAVIINGEEKVAVIEKRKDGTVIINVPKDSGEVETVVTDEKGLMKFESKYMPKPVLYSEKSETAFGNAKKEQKSGYAGYVDSFYSDDVNVLKKRVKQSKYVGIASASAAVLAAISLLKNGLRVIPGAIGVFAGLAALNCYTYNKQTQEKISQLEANA